MTSISIDIVDVEVIELAGRAVAFELGGIGVHAGTLQQLAQLLDVMRGHLFLDAIRAEAFDLALHIEARLVERVAEVGAGVAAYHQAAGLCHEGAHRADAAADHDIDALHGNAAARAGVTLDDDEATLAGC